MRHPKEAKNIETKSEGGGNNRRDEEQKVKFAERTRWKIDRKKGEINNGNDKNIVKLVMKTGS